MFRRYRGFSSEAKLFLLSVTLGSVGGSISWLLLNLYLQSLEHSQSVIGAINAASALAVAIVGLPVGIISDRFSRKGMLILGTGILALGALGLSLSSAALTLITSAVLAGIGWATIMSNTSPFLMENSTAAQRTALFSLASALSTATGFMGSLLGGYLPTVFANWLLLSPQDVLPLRITLLLVAVLQFTAIIPLWLLHPAATHLQEQALNGPYSAKNPQAELPKVAPLDEPRRWHLSLSLSLHLSSPILFVKLLLPEAFIGLGAGLIIPFLNIYVTGKFGISFEVLGWLFAISSLMTAAGMIFQPILADRLGKVYSVVLVQGLSLPFLIVMGYVPYLPLVAVALLMRGMLMNMASPVYMAFSMEQLPPRERATFTGAMGALWELTWSMGSGISGWLRDFVGFEWGFNLEFALMTLFYALSTAMLYIFFCRKPEVR